MCGKLGKFHALSPLGVHNPVAQTFGICRHLEFASGVGDSDGHSQHQPQLVSSVTASHLGDPWPGVKDLRNRLSFAVRVFSLSGEAVFFR